MREKDYYGAIKGFCLKWNLPEVWNSDRITGANLIYEVVKVINAMILEQKATKEMIEEFIRMFDEDLSDTVKDQLTVWLNNGTLGDIINETLFNTKLDVVDFNDFKNKINNEQKFPFTEPLKIVYSFNYENNDLGKIERLTQLGFNTVWMTKQLPLMFDIEQTLSFLDRLKQYGIRAIMDTDLNALNQTDITKENELAWINAVSKHVACLGFCGYDEPTGQMIPKAKQRNVYESIKSQTVKPVFVVMGDTNYDRMANYYEPDSYDVLLLDTYFTEFDMINTDVSVAEKIVKEGIVERIMNFLTWSGSRQPKQIIPMFPLFQGDSFNLITPEVFKHHLDAWRPFINNGIYSVFLHDVVHTMTPESNYISLDTNETLRDLLYFAQGYLTTTNGYNYVAIKPQGIKNHPNYTDSANLFYQVGGIGPVVKINGSEGFVEFKMLLNPGATKIVLSTNIRSTNHVVGRTVQFYVMFEDAYNEGGVYSIEDPSPKNAFLKTVSYDIPDSVSAVKIKIVVAHSESEVEPFYNLEVLGFGATSV